MEYAAPITEAILSRPETIRRSSGTFEHGWPRRPHWVMPRGGQGAAHRGLPASLQQVPGFYIQVLIDQCRGHRFGKD
ncbi:MAG: hypothetical protein ACQESR_24065, partial [Planctomycetota bacterium]